MRGNEWNGRIDRSDGGVERMDAVRPSGSNRVQATEDLFLDFTEVGTIDLPGLALLFTAQQLASEEDRNVWVMGLPMQFWELLRALGLEGYFLHFPERGESRA
jgi:ABC-type transporter Mla MlaB component